MGSHSGFPEVKIILPGLLCKTFIDEFGVLVSPGEFFEYPGHFRLCLTRSPEKTRLGLKALSDALSKDLETGPHPDRCLREVSSRPPFSRFRFSS